MSGGERCRDGGASERDDEGDAVRERSCYGGNGATMERAPECVRENHEKKARDLPARQALGRRMNAAC